MEFKPDWLEAQERFTAWWNGSSIGRPALHITASIPGEQPPPPVPDDPMQFWTDADSRIMSAEHRFRHTYYGAEAFPYFDTNIGPGSLAMYLGCQPRFAPDTVWYEPLADGIAEMPELSADFENEWWLANVRLVEEGMERGQGRYLTSLPDIIENLDIVSSMVGPQQVLYDLVDDPGAVAEAIRQVNEFYFTYYDKLYGMLEGDRLGSCFSAFSIWGAGRVAKVQCDACAMISPEMFDAVVAPSLREQTDRLDYSVYHLDGPDAVKHLDSLLALPGLNAIQWTPHCTDPGVGSEMWWPMYRKVREAGKGLLLLGARYHEVEPLARHLGPDGVLIGANAPSVDAAKDLIHQASTW